MRRIIVSALWAVIVLFHQGAEAAARSWIQLEAKFELTEAMDRARALSAIFPNVNGFRTRGGAYALALGPYADAKARAELRALRRERLVPRDAFVTDGREYRQRFWPVGVTEPDTTDETAAALPGTDAPAALADTETGAAPADPAALALPGSALPDETPAEARASEALLDEDTRKEIQRALAWFGHYTTRIDGDFGPATRRAMAAWQAENGHEPTGILTTAQRAALLKAYEDELAALGLRRHRDEAAGIDLPIPAALVEFDRYEAPFVHFAPKGDSGVRLLLISEPGGADALAALFDVIDTFRIIPEGGERQARRNTFEISARDARRSAYAWAEARDGAVKGFILTWPRERDPLMARLPEIMRQGFEVLPDAVLPPGASEPEGETFAGIEIRHPVRRGSGLYVDTAGHVVTAHAVVSGCGRVTVDDVPADIALDDPTAGVAVLAPRADVAPPGAGHLAETMPGRRAEIAVAGYSFGGLLGAPTLSFGRLEAAHGLNGEAWLARLSVTTTEADVGGPVLGPRGEVLGILVPAAEGRQLPEGVGFMLRADALAERLAALGIRPARGGEGDAPAEPEDLARRAAEFTATVACWD
ncbi:MAG: peptidoglycan-binding protein [Alphaproteobacteria bacterium]|nr:MAG: peptidoglycan-binding protein [Alphaproteobacteria bacterium]